MKNTNSGGKALKDHNIGNYNQKADERQTDTISRWINGGRNGLEERRFKTDYLLRKFNAKNCINMVGMPKP